MVGETERFRRDLAGVLDKWIQADLVSADHAAKLRTHYRLDDLDESASSRFVQTILVLGAVLIGLGVVSFIAANWELIPPWLRATGCTGLMVAFDAGGWKLWAGGKHARWGTVLLLIGTFLLGADIGLVAQWYQVGGDGGGLFLGWGLGALAMAWGLRHAGVGAIGAGALAGALMLEWFAPWLPWVYVAAVLPLALATRSVVLLGLGMAGMWLAIGKLAIDAGPPAFTAVMLATAVGAMGLAALGRHLPALRGYLVQDAEHDPGFATVADRLGALIIAGFLVGWSFRALWSEEIGSYAAAHAGTTGLASAFAFAGVAAAVAALAIFRHPEARPALLTSAAAAGALAVAVMTAQGSGVESPEGYALLTNVALAGFALQQAYDGLARADRGPFWMGVGLLTIQVACRFMEYDTGLLLKSAAFVAWGVGLIMAGLWFEKLRAARKAGKQAAA